MKHYLAFVLSLFVVVHAASAAPDPGATYADAFVLIQEGQTAEQGSDFATAAQKYNFAIDLLRGIRKDSADWNPQVVEFRLKDAVDKLEAVRGKVPPAPAPKPVQPPTPIPAPAAPGEQPAPLNVELSSPNATARLRNELDRLKEDNARLLRDLEAAKSAPVAPVRNDGQLDKLKKDNRQLTQQIETSEREIADLKRQLAAKPVDSAEVRALHAQLADAKAELDKSRTTAQRQIAELQQQNLDLAAKLDAARKQSAVAESKEIEKLRTELAKANSQITAARQAESEEAKKLRAELAKAKAEADEAKQRAVRAEADRAERAALGRQLADLEKMNATLRDEVTTGQKQLAAANKTIAELKSLQAELDKTKADLADNRKSNQQQITELQRQNKSLATQLDTVKAQAGKPSEELAKLRRDLEAARAEADKARQLSAKTPELESQNKELAAKLASAQKQAAAESAESKTLQAQLDAARAAAEKTRRDAAKIPNLEKENAQLASQLADLRKAQAGRAAQNFGPAVRASATNITRPTHEADALQQENSQLKALLAEVKKQTDAKTAAESKADSLSRNNRELAISLASALTKVRDLEKLVAVKSSSVPADAAELKNLRAELAEARAHAAKVDEVARQNKELTDNLSTTQARVTDLQQQLAAKAGTSPADSAELKALRSQLSDARADAAKADDLLRQNRELANSLTTTQGQITNLQKQLSFRTAASVADAAELKSLRTQLSDARANLAQSEDLARQNRELTGRLNTAQGRVAELEKQVSTKAAAAPADSPELRKLQAQLVDARAELNAVRKASTRATELVEQNRQLSQELAAQKSDLAMLHQTRAELTEVRAVAEKAQADAVRAKQLEVENITLTDKLAQAQRNAFVRPLTVQEATEISKLRKQVEEMRIESIRGAEASTRADDLLKENNKLRDQLEEARKAQPIQVEFIDNNKRAGSATISALAPKDTSVMKNLREENSYLRHLLESYVSQIPELKPRLRKIEQEKKEAAPAPPPAK